MTQSKQIPVAIIGIDCIFAKSQDKKAFYHLLSKNTSGITDPPDSHQHLNECYDPDPKKPDHIYCNRGGYLPTVKFDPTEFSIPPNVIEATDTSQLLSLVTAKKALDDAGYGENGKPFDHSKASVILGVTGTQELVIPLGARLGHPIWRRALKNSGVPDDQANEVIQRIGDGYVTWQENSFPGLLGNVVAGRIANRFDLGGTNCVVDAACASSMGAIHVALLELRSRRSDMVITGGVDTINDAFMHMCFSKTQILSASGDIRPFSKDADGTVLGEGIGLVVLKRLEDAERDGDRIYAVIRGLGSSSDGKSQSIYAPRPEGQVRALRRAYEEAGVDPASVSLVEAHGTGTLVGDEVEFKTLCKVFGQESPNGNRCALGSVKSNIGHTKAAAGAAGLIKAALSIYHKVLLPTRNAENADPKLGVEHSPFYLNTQLRPWLSKNGNNRRAGISAFGFGGSNFHTVLEEHSSDKLEPSWDGSVEIAAFSGSDEHAVIQQIVSWAKETTQETTVQNIGKQSKRSRKKFQSNDPLRLVMVLDISEEEGIIGRICDDAVGRLSGKKPSGNHLIYIGRGNPDGKLAFLFPGQGSQYVGMGKDLICCLPESLNAFQEASGHLSEDDTLDEYVYPRMISNARGLEDKLRQTQIAQPAIGAVSVAMLNALTAFGLKPDVTCGHSYGELVALHAAGWMDRQDLWNLSVQRGRLMAQAGASAVESGTMMAVKAPVHEIDALVQTLDGQVVLANRNSLDQGVLSGTCAGIDAAETACKEKEWRTVRLPVAAAFHSPLVADAQKPFGDCVQSVTFTPNSTLVMSNTIGSQYPTSIEKIQTTLGKQLACPVDFVSNVNALYEKGVRTYVEVGPKSVLTQLVRATLEDKAVTTIAMDQSKGRGSGIKDLAATLSQLAALGFSITLDNWEKPQSPSRKVRMAIDLSGANFRNPKAPRKASVAQPKNTLVHHTQNKGHDLTDQSNKPDVGQHQAKQKRPIANKPSTPPRPLATQPSVGRQEYKNVEQALTTVQQGMASIQALQSQTVQAHQKFLETQAEASKTLQQMMQSAQQLSMNVGGDPDPTAPVAPPIIDSAPSVEMALISSAPSPLPSIKVKASAPAEKPPEAKTQDPQISSIQAANSNNSVLKDSVELKLLDIVSELTGYPVEMLGTEMDIESDLGIDSIKRVEILSALEEKMPYLPRVSPDMMGTLKTLGQICDFLSASTEGTQPAPATVSVPKSGTDSDDVFKIQQTLTGIVSELTGYPAEMLGAEMDIESDLGIDSIKRVEILSALEEKMPNLPKVTPDMMGTLKTLGQICDFLSVSPDAAEAPLEPSTPPIPGATENLQEIQQTLIDIVSQLTGYPAEMLGTEMDIESDLGIDSIKRVEILSALEEKMPHLPKVTPDMMGTLKTLGQIIAYLGKVPEDIASEPENHPQAKIHVVKNPADEKDDKIDRRIIKIQAMEKPLVSAIDLPEDHFIGVIGGFNDLEAELVTTLKKNGVMARHLKHIDEITPELPLAGLILIAPMESRAAFRWAKAGAPLLQKTAQHTSAYFATISALDGAFGFSGRQIDDPSQGGLAGLAKTAKIEWPGVNCKAMDIDPGWEDIPAVAQAVCESILFTDPKSPVEIGLNPDGRIGLTLESVTADDNRTIDLTRKDVVIVTGGARGVTAAASKALASQTPCTLVLMGRSPAPQPEPDWLAPLSNEGDIKKAILNQLSHQAKTSPKEVEHIYQKWMANRQVLATLSDLRHMGTDAHYFSTDVRDFDAIHAQLEKIRREMGPIRALIHGAGVLEDRFIVDKQVKQFSKVYDTKVKGLIALLNATMADDLKYVVLFSSVSARMGNQGQVDYAMANEVLNKTAWQQHHIRPDCKVISINWGPWDGGMVTPSLKRNFIKNNVSLIPIDSGARAMVTEMAQSINDAVEVVIGGPLPKSIETVKEAEEPATALTLTCKRDVSLDRYPVLHSHQLDGRPVVPLALITEWLAHSALHANPGLVLHGLDNLRLLNGIILDRQKRMIQLLAGRAHRNGSVYEVEVEIRDGMNEGLGRVHSSASAVLSEVLPTAPKFKENGHFKPGDAPHCLDDIYKDVLFHGQDLQGIMEIIRISEDGISAKLATAPPPDQWINEPLRSRWIADPLVLDSAFQLAIVWCHKHYGLVSLPSFAATYRQYCHRFPDTGISAVLEIQKSDQRKMVGNFTFLDKDKKVLACLKGYEAIMDPSLSKAFKAA